ncbi:hypothetical protein A2U01_0109606, partial [Trifolium medium]|nr:hypothetical protein [Trifolium medium]
SHGVFSYAHCQGFEEATNERGRAPT